MKVKNTALLLVLATLSLPSIAAQPGKCGAGYDRWDLNCDGKIDGKEAYASMKPYENHHRAVSMPANREGLPPPSEAGYPLRAPESELEIHILYYNPNGLKINSGKGKSVRLSKNISDYQELRMTYRLQAEGVHRHTRNMTINTDLWHVDRSHSKQTKLYRYSEQVGVDKNRWDSINFWRIAPNRIWVQELCDTWRYCAARLIAVEGIK